MTALRGAARTDIGRVRSVNQDGALTSPFLVAVADGMGGHRAGEVASALALRVDGRPRALRHRWPMLVDGVQRANGSIFEAAAKEPDLRGMGTTLCALAAGGSRRVPKERLALVNVGDSRAYRVRNGDLAQLTVDHSLVQLMVEEGQLRPDEAESHPQRNILTRALGIEANVAVDGWQLDAVPGERFLICSDGLFNEVEPGRIAATLRAYADPGEAARVLVGLANAAGGRDNVTCVVVDVVDGRCGPAAEPPMPMRPPMPRGRRCRRAPPVPPVPPGAGTAEAAAGPPRRRNGRASAARRSRRKTEGQERTTPGRAAARAGRRWPRPSTRRSHRQPGGRAGGDADQADRTATTAVTTLPPHRRFDDEDDTGADRGAVVPEPRRPAG